MNSYLLLRDNKEKGPFSLEQLIQVGFKPYDLVWIQGKSAAWRYPGEVEELKAYAPVIEEQPFDRFFKKPERTLLQKSGEKREETSPSIKTEVTKTVHEVPKEEIITHERKVPVDIGIRKSIYVTMPFQKKELPAEEPLRAYMPREYSEEPVKTISITENPAAAQVKYPEPIEELKEAYAKNFQQRKQKIARKSMLLQRAKKASVFLYMTALGVIIGFAIRSYSGKKNIAAAQKTLQTQSAVKEPEQAQNTNTTTIAQAEKQPEIVKPEVKQNLNLSSEVNAESTEKKIAIDNTGPVAEKKQTISNRPIDTNQESPGIEINSLTGERTKKSRTEGFTGNEKEEKTVSKNDISSQVSVKGNDYKRGAFGGIRDLQLTVVNNSKYILDNVTVELVYIKANELPLKTDNIQFHSVSPNGSMTIAIPPTNRGVKVTYKIIKIESKEFNETAGL